MERDPCRFWPNCGTRFEPDGTGWAVSCSAGEVGGCGHVSEVTAESYAVRTTPQIPPKPAPTIYDEFGHPFSPTTPRRTVAEEYPY